MRLLLLLLAALVSLLVKGFRIGFVVPSEVTFKLQSYHLRQHQCIGYKHRSVRTATRMGLQQHKLQQTQQGEGNHRLIEVDKTLCAFLLCSLFATVRPGAVRVLLTEAAADAAWQVLLPASLFLSILSSTPTQPAPAAVPAASATALVSASGGSNSGGGSSSSSGGGSGKLSVRQQLEPAVLIAFAFGAIGSVAGGLCSFAAHRLLIDTAAAATAAAVPIIVCTGALTASYIGGTANFFETAANLRPIAARTGAEAAMQSAVTCVAAADIGVMIAYFQILKLIRSCTTGRARSNSNRNSNSSSGISSSGVSIHSKGNEDKDALGRRMKSFTRRLVVVASLMLSAAAVTAVCGWLQSRFFTAVPGVAVLLVTLASTASSRLLRWFQHRSSDSRSDSSSSISSISSSSSSDALLRGAAVGAEVLLVAFYAVLGLQAPWQDVLQLGPAYALLFALMLSCHLGVLFTAAAAWNRLSRGGVFIDIDSILIAR